MQARWAEVREYGRYGGRIDFSTHSRVARSALIRRLPRQKRHFCEEQIPYAASWHLRNLRQLGRRPHLQCSSADAAVAEPSLITEIGCVATNSAAPPSAGDNILSSLALTCLRMHPTHKPLLQQFNTFRYLHVRLFVIKGLRPKLKSPDGVLISTCGPQLSNRIPRALHSVGDSTGIWPRGGSVFGHQHHWREVRHSALPPHSIQSLPLRLESLYMLSLLQKDSAHPCWESSVFD